MDIISSHGIYEITLSFLTLSALEIVLGLDNIIFISILSGRLPESQRAKARKLGLAGAFATRLLLLSLISFIVRLTQPLFTLASVEFTGKSLVLLAGGIFLIYKATKEIHHKLEDDPHESEGSKSAKNQFGAVIFQIMLLDMVFSLDSVITAVGMAQDLRVMVAANVLALIVMLAAGGVINSFVERHPTVKVLALSFLLMIGLVLVADGLSFHIPKGYVYFSMGFSIFVEFINIKASKKAKHVKLFASKV